ncbi:MAG: hypothetical protein KC503_26650 [Myxococcales bacterium]|nr:hypothetical protein [Myxococcales bacterium]
MPPRDRLGDILLRAGLLDEEGLNRALNEQQRWGGPLGRYLVDLSLISEETLIRALSTQYKLPAVALDAPKLSHATARLIPREVCERHRLICFRVDRARRFLDVAMTDPSNVDALDEVRVKTGFNVRPHIAGPNAVDKAITTVFYGDISAGGEIDLSPGSPLRAQDTGQLARSERAPAGPPGLDVPELQVSVSTSERDSVAASNAFADALAAYDAASDDIDIEPGVTSDSLPVLDVHVTSTTGKGPTRAPRRPPPSAPEIAALDLSKLDTPEPAPAPAPPREAPSRVSPRAITAVDSPIADVGTATSLRAIASQVALAAPHQPPAEPSAFKLPEPVATDEGFHITMDLPVLDKETIENEDVKRRIERLEALARRDSALIEKLINTLVDRGILGADEIAKLLGSRGQ